MGLWKRTRIWAVLFTFLALASCSGTGTPGDTLPAAPPVPPAEIPSFLQFPESLAIDFSELNQAEGNPSVSALQTQFASDQTREEIIRDRIEFIVGSSNEFNETLEFLLQPASNARIPVRPQQQDFETVVEMTGMVEGFPQTVSLNAVFDFRDFDFDGDNQPDGCSGCTCPVGCEADGLSVCPAEAPATDFKPVCFRIWLNNERYMAGKFDASPASLPTEGNPGAGVFRASETLDMPNVEAEISSARIGANYDQRDSDKQFNDLFLHAFLGGVNPIATHIISEAVLSGADLIKTFNATANIFDSPEDKNPQFFAKQVSKFREGTDFIGLHVVAGGIDDDTGEFTGELPILSPPICAQISTAIETSLGICQDLEIDVTGIDFASDVQEADVTLPPLDDFPDL